MHKKNAVFNTFERVISFQYRQTITFPSGSSRLLQRETVVNQETVLQMKRQSERSLPQRKEQISIRFFPAI